MEKDVVAEKKEEEKPKQEAEPAEGEKTDKKPIAVETKKPVSYAAAAATGVPKKEENSGMSCFLKTISFLTTIVLSFNQITVRHYRGGM